MKGADSHKTDIYVVKNDGSELTKITGDGVNAHYTSMAKDRVAYSAGPKGKDITEIYTAKFDGSDIRKITKDSSHNTAPAFSPDGKHIAFVSDREAAKYQMYVMDADGSNIKRLSHDDNVGFFNPQWSPNGKYLVYYVEKGDGKDQIWTMRSDGSRQMLLTANTGHNIFPG